MRRRPAPPGRRLSAALLASLWVFGLVASLWHGRAEEHVYCAEHDTFEEAGERASQPPPDSRELAATDAADDPREAHEACAFFDAGAVGAPGDESTAQAFLVLDSAPRPGPAPGAAFAPIELLRLAPKGSPPGSVVSSFA